MDVTKEISEEEFRGVAKLAKRRRMQLVCSKRDCCAHECDMICDRISKAIMRNYNAVLE